MLMGDIRDARVPCEHGRFEPHDYKIWDGLGRFDPNDLIRSCEGGRPVTVDDFNVREAAFATGLWAPSMEDFATDHARIILAAALQVEEDADA